MTGSCTSGQASSASGRDATAPAGDDGAAVLVAGGAPDERLEHAPAVERQAGHEVEHADQQVGAGEAPRSPSRTSPSGITRPRRRTPAPTAIEVSGPTTAIQNSWRGRARLPVDLGHAAEEVQRDRVDAVAQALGDDRVGRLVEQHGEVEHDREHEAGDVLPEPQTGLRPASMRGPNASEISSATTNHELVMRTSMPDDRPDAQRAARARGGAAGRRRQALDRWVRARSTLTNLAHSGGRPYAAAAAVLAVGGLA